MTSKNDLLAETDFCVVDTETTGGSPFDNRIIDIAVVQFRGEEIVDKYQTLINPGRPIPEWITNLTQINDDMVKDAPTFEEVAKPLRQILDRGIFAAHNAKFDFGFVREEFRRVNEEFDSPICCSLRLARQLYPDLPSKSLGVLCDYLMIDIWDRHRASGDAEATTYVLKDLLRKANREYGIKTWRELDGFQKFGKLLLPEGIRYHHIVQLPQKPGVFFLKDEKGKLILKSQTKDIQRRVQTLFQAANQSSKSQHLRDVVRKIDCMSEN